MLTFVIAPAVELPTGCILESRHFQTISVGSFESEDTSLFQNLSQIMDSTTKKLTESWLEHGVEKLTIYQNGLSRLPLTTRGSKLHHSNQKVDVWNRSGLGFWLRAKKKVGEMVNDGMSKKKVNIFRDSGAESGTIRIRRSEFQKEVVLVF